MPRRDSRPPRHRSSSPGSKPSGGRPRPKTASGDRPKPPGGRPSFKTAPRGKTMPVLAGLIATIAPKVLRDVLDRGKRLESAIVDAQGDEAKKKSTRSDRMMINRSLASLVRWWGWIEPLKLVHVEEQLLLAWLLDAPDLPAVARLWASRAGRDPSRLFSGGDAPNWTARAETLKRFVAGRAVVADPWMPFPNWLRDELPLPPGEESAKVRKLHFLHAVQAPPSLWVAVRGRPPKDVWNELHEEGLKPWVQRKIESAARLDRDTDLRRLESFQAGSLLVEDLGSQAVAKVCDPDPGERWWDVGDGAGLFALGLADEMAGKGTIISTFEHEPSRLSAVKRLRSSPYTNVAAKTWDGRRPPGKPESFDGVLVAPPSSGVGSWRRHPEVRWIIKADQLPELVARQKKLLHLAATAVRPGGTLVYTVGTVTLRETQALIHEFLEESPDFRLDPFPHPLEDGETTGMLQLWPQTHDCEARFIARLVRTARPTPTPPSKTTVKNPPPS